jgi:hypothetical protein
MNVRRLTTAALAIGLAATTAPRLRAQSITFSFGDNDRRAMREWYRAHADAPEFSARRWNAGYERGLQVGLVLNPTLRAWARPAPADLYGRLPPLPAGYRYMVVGDHLVVVDRGWRIAEVNHFERFADDDQAALREWYPANRDAPVFRGRNRWNDRLERQIQVGAILPVQIQRMSRPAPPDLVSRLPRRPRHLRYVIVGDHVVLVDRWWTVREDFRFPR